jgi:hypothetical protein
MRPPPLKLRPPLMQRAVIRIQLQSLLDGELRLAVDFHV